MVQQLKQLLVTADIDASGYARGAQQKKAADDAMVQSGRQVAATVSQVDTRLSQAADGIEKFKRQMVTGYAATTDFERGQRALVTALNKTRMTTDEAVSSAENLYRRYGSMVDPLRLMAKGHVEAANAVTALNARLAEQKRLVPANDGAAGYRRQNLGYQAFDIGQGMASGMPLPLIAAQQLPQVAQLYSGAGGLKAAMGDVGALAMGAVTAIGSIPLALGVAGTAAIMYANRNEVSLKTADEALARHKANIEALGTAYGIAEQRAKSYSNADRAVANAAVQGSLQDLGKLQAKAASELSLQFGSLQTPGRGGQAFYAPYPDYKPFANAFRDLRNAPGEGEKFIDQVAAVAKLNPESSKFADNIYKAAQQFLKINKEASETEDALERIRAFETMGPNRMLLSRGTVQRADDTAWALFESQSRVSAERSRQAFQAQLVGVRARSPDERSEAARLMEASRYDLTETPAARRQRIDQAGALAQAQAQQQITLAQEQRAASLRKMVEDQQHEIDMIGKTGSELVMLRKQYELISQAKQEAAANGRQVDQQEIEMIRQKSAELATLTDAYDSGAFASSFNLCSEDVI